MRTLYYVPVLHSSVESTGEFQLWAVTFRDALGEEEQYLLDAWLSQFWHAAKRRIVAWLAHDEVQAARFHVFVDGLPVALDRTGTPVPYDVERPLNPHEHLRNLVWVLVHNGAVLHGTEDPGLIRRCREHAARHGAVWTPDGRQEPWLVSERDAFIARNVCDTLPDGHAGILFMGALHRTDDAVGSLDPHMRIVHVMENPISGAPATPLPPRF
ncbi:MAG TPA: hypothetical protein VD862_03445 [Candidatus Paceibacterota bacterium]|nr:hypothetical protein [Candidatus Paceibacterota bacterium]